MSSICEQEIEDGVFEDVESPSVGLVPLTETQAVYEARRVAISRPDPSFLTQLIAAAEHVPQTCELRRAAPTEALSAYRASAEALGQRTSDTSHHLRETS